MTAPMPREELLTKALERITARTPTDNRCRQCGYKFFSDGMERHSENCAYLVACEALRDGGVAQTAPSAVVVEALDNSQSLLVMVFHLAETNDGGIPALDWANEDLSKLVTEQIVENRGALSNQGASK